MTPYVLIKGPEQVLADRALSATLEDVRRVDTEVIRLTAETYQRGDLQIHASPSLFGGHKVLVVHDLDEGGDDLIDDLTSLVKEGVDDLTVIVLHKSGNRGKRALDALKAAKARVIEAPEIKTDRAKSDFVTNEFRVAGRKATPDAVRALVEAVGKDVRELAAACQQLVDDTSGLIDADVVETYHGGRVEATGFRVADAAIAGDAGAALTLLRHAVAAGVDPVPIVAVLASQLRQVARVATAGGGNSQALAGKLGMAPWQIDRARKAAAGWDGVRLGRAIQAVAAADFDVKGGGRDPVFAVERAVRVIAAERNGRAALGVG
ncbi:DNA polymerase III delta subunit [Branchiibius hedensis]|uniref:DNA-directed DNA polymerase n=1 Tax=Branchiibius hedensis TaxID=672460 RepID=A0A2Y8ZNF7_9MICO|nr:DNA polymerase III delta subunit [Branchiibius hedensis]SSA33495.1 DNA polymerase III, delta subunit [Branchiibius hedensis]